MLLYHREHSWREPLSSKIIVKFHSRKLFSILLCLVSACETWINFNLQQIQHQRQQRIVRTIQNHQRNMNIREHCWHKDGCISEKLLLGLLSNSGKLLHLSSSSTKHFFLYIQTAGKDEQRCAAEGSNISSWGCNHLFLKEYLHPL